jgi:hypothetical protein
VDAIPSDLSAGDTVKAAIGTATNFANGNGETVHGDIGTIGGGANGGTNINSLSRGQEGTTASSFSEGDPVRVGVQGRDDAGPEQAVLQSQVIKPGPRLVAYDDFDRPDGSLSGDTLPSGQSWSTVDATTASISSRRAELGPNNNAARLLWGSGNSPFLYQKALIRTPESDIASAGIIIAHETNTDYIEAVITDPAILQLAKVVGGTRTVIDSQDIYTERAARAGIFELTTMTGRPLFPSLAAECHGATVVLDTFNDSEAETIFNNSTDTGLIGRNVSPNYFEHYIAYDNKT